MDYVELRKEVIEANLLERQYGYYAFKITLSLAMVVGVLFLLFAASSFWVQLPLVVALAFAVMQFGFLGHDAGHQAIFASQKWNDFFGNIFTGFFIGVAYNYWVNKHNLHHASPNHEDDDPDFSILFSLSEKKARGKRGLMRLVTLIQHYLFIPIAGTYFFGMQILSIAYNFRNKGAPGRLVASSSVAASIITFGVAPFFFMELWKLLIFIPLFRFAMGSYFGSVVASNHKGMPVVTDDDKLDFIQKQVLTTRNVKGGLLVDFVYGGLNRQIEHHLFPTMPRNNLSKSKSLVMRFCAENNLAYEEAGVVKSWKLILGELKKMSRYARKGSAAGMPVSVVSKSGEGA